MAANCPTVEHWAPEGAITPLSPERLAKLNALLLAMVRARRRWMDRSRQGLSPAEVDALRKLTFESKFDILSPTVQARIAEAMPVFVSTCGGDCSDCGERDICDDPGGLDENGHLRVYADQCETNALTFIERIPNGLAIFDYLLRDFSLPGDDRIVHTPGGAQATVRQLASLFLELATPTHAVAAHLVGTGRAAFTRLVDRARDAVGLESPGPRKQSDIGERTLQMTQSMDPAKACRNPVTRTNKDNQPATPHPNLNAGPGGQDTQGPGWRGVGLDQGRVKGELDDEDDAARIW